MYRDNFSAKKVLELDKKGSYEKDGLFYKSANQFVELRLNKLLYSDGLTKSHYVIPVAYIYDLEQRFIGYCTRMQYDFKTIEQKLLDGDEFDKRQVFNTIWSLIQEMYNEGIFYHDIHTRNFLVNDENFVKVLDFDDYYYVYPEQVGYRSLTSLLSFYLSMVLEVYLYPCKFLLETRLYYLVKSTGLFPPEVVEYIQFIMEGNPLALTHDVNEILDQLEDPEKIKYLKGKL